MSCARLRFHAIFKVTTSGPEVSLRGLHGHLLHTVTFLVKGQFQRYGICDKVEFE